MDGIYKHSDQLQFRDEARLSPISDLSIGFYNLDINTAILNFQVTKQGQPMLLSKNHVTSYCILRSSDNKNVSRVLEFDIVDGMNGLLRLQVPNEFLKAVSKPDSVQKVIGQAYLSVNGKEDTVVFSEFNFRVKDALINQISSEVKVEYIRMFDDLEREVHKRVVEIEEEIARGEDYVAEMKQTVSYGIKTINDLVDKSEKNINDTVSQAKADIDNNTTIAIRDFNGTVTQAKKDINALSEDTISDISKTATDINNLSDTTIENINRTATDATNKIETTQQEYLDSIEKNELVNKNDIKDLVDNSGLTETLQSLNWQKQAFTRTDGAFIFLTETIDLNDLSTFISNYKPGFYSSNNINNTPTGWKSGSIMYFKPFNNTSLIVYFDSGESDLYINGSFSDKWTGWKKISAWKLLNGDYSDFTTDTGWVGLPLMNGAQPNTYNSSYLPVSYRVIEIFNKKFVQIRGNIDKLSTNMVFAQLTSDISPAKNIEYKVQQRIGTGSAVGYLTSDGTMKVVGAIDSSSTYLIDLNYMI